MSPTDPRFCRGDRVERVDAVPGRRPLRPGLVGEVLIGDESDPVMGLLTVAFPGFGRPWQLRRAHRRPWSHGRRPTALDEE